MDVNHGKLNLNPNWQACATHFRGTLVGIEALCETAMQIDRSLHGAPSAAALSHCRDSVPGSGHQAYRGSAEFVRSLAHWDDQSMRLSLRSCMVMMESSDAASRSKYDRGWGAHA